MTCNEIRRLFTTFVIEPACVLANVYGDGTVTAILGVPRLGIGPISNNAPCSQASRDTVVAGLGHQQARSSVRRADECQYFTLQYNSRMNIPVDRWAAPLRERLTGLPEAERARFLLDAVRAEVAAVTGVETPCTIEVDLPWRRLGIYREFATGLRERLSKCTGLRMPATVFFNYPTPAVLACYLHTELLGGPAVGLIPAPEQTNADDDPIAIVGMACRFPGNVGSPDELWRLAAEGRDAISSFPEGRGWDATELYHPDADRPNSTYSRGGGFLHDVDQFDAGFFGISPREATALDPQQRLLLDTSWEALEHAGIDPLSLAGSRTGVYVGIAYQDYGPHWHEPPKGYEGYLLMGSLTSAASGRISYTWGLEGPAMTVDTACSSSLVALHLAAQALRGGECSLALAGGATVMATPGVFLEFSRKRALAPDGRCKSFSADADGTGWGEGAGMLVLERLSDARRSGHRVLALIRGSALNQDGASNGLTAPNGLSQQRVIRQALANAGLSPDEIDAVEAHGTGTALGDPIEAQALIATYGQSRPADRPLWVGSLKSNIGHSQAAAVVGGVIKMVLAMQHGVLPKTLHVTEPSPHVDWSAGAVSLLTESRPWPRTGRPRRAGISAFGVSGTNGHLILEEAPAPGGGTGGEGVAADPAEGVALPWVISAREASTLRAHADRLRTHLSAHPALRPVDVGYSLAARTRFKHRAVLVATEHEGFRRGLDALAEACTAPGLVSGAVRAGVKVAFLFPGQGSQRPGMGRELYETFPVFARAWDDVCARVDAHLGRSLGSVAWPAEGSAGAELLDQTAYTQVALFAVEVALFRLVTEWGVASDFLIGHSIGELAAAHVAGVLSLDAACTLVVARGHLMQACSSGGAMVAIQAHETEVNASLAGWGSQIDIATVNGPLSTVIAGGEDAVLQVAQSWEARGRKTRRVRVSHAFHSHHMDGMLEDFRRVAESISFEPPTIPIVSNLTGKIATADQLCSADYWVRHVRQAVRFLDGMHCLQSMEVTAFLELGPGTVLTAMAQDCHSDEDTDRAVFVPALRTERDEAKTLMMGLAELNVRGVHVNWQESFTDRGAQRINLPTYSFQRQRYWWDAPQLPPQDTTDPAVVDNWRYRIVWKAVDRETDRHLDGTWLVAIPAAQAREEHITALIRGLSGPAARIVPFELNGKDACRQVIGERLGRALEKGITGVMSLLALDETPHAEYPVLPAGLALTVALVQALDDVGSRAPLYHVTRGAVSVADSDPLHSPAQAMVWGLGRIVGLEQPRHQGCLVDLPAGPGWFDDAVIRRLCGMLGDRDAHQGLREVALRETGTWVRRLVRAKAGRRGTPWRPQGTILITGGTGALGATAARWLARHGAQRLVLVSRRGTDAPGAAELIAELAALGTQVTVAACDVRDQDEVASVLAAQSEPVTSVVHAAGVVGHIAPLTETSLAEVADVVAGKVAGASHLDALLEHAPLDAFVLFSSVAGTWGARGQAGYGAANAFLEALAQQRRARGLAATSIAWGPWAEAGMAATDPDLETHLRRHGIPPMSPFLAIEALWQAVAHDEPALTIADVDWPVYLPTLTMGRPNPFFADIPETRPTPTVPDDPAARSRNTNTSFVSAGSVTWTGCAQRLLGAGDAERQHILLDLVRTHAAAILGYVSSEEVDPELRFLELGFDSLAAVEMRKRLSTSTGMRLPAAIVLEHPNSFTLAQYLAKELADQTDRLIAHARKNEALLDSPASAVTPTIRLLYRSACERGLVAEGIDLLRAAAKLRPMIYNPEEFGKPIKPVQLARGSMKPTLVCLPPIVAPSGPHNYAHLAAPFDKIRDVVAFAHPGFGDGEPLPASRELLVKMHADAIREHLGDTPFALAGYSSGGWVTNSIAAHLESLDVFPTTVIFLDCLPLRHRVWDKMYKPLQTLAVREQGFGLTTDDQLTAMACYFDHFEDWKPEPIKAPIVLIRATEPIPEWRGDSLVKEYFWKAEWDIPLEIMEVPGDHFTLMNENANSTAAALQQWFTCIEA